MRPVLKEWSCQTRGPEQTLRDGAAAHVEQFAGRTRQNLLEPFAFVALSWAWPLLGARLLERASAATTAGVRVPVSNKFDI